MIKNAPLQTGTLCLLLFLYSALVLAGTCPGCNKPTAGCVCDEGTHMSSWGSYTHEASAALTSLQDQASTLQSFSETVTDQPTTTTWTPSTDSTSSPMRPCGSFSRSRPLVSVSDASSGSSTLDIVPRRGSGLVLQLPTCQQSSQALQSLITIGDLQAWVGITGYLSNLNELLKQAVQNSRRNLQRITQIQKKAEALIQRGCSQQEAYDQAKEEVGEEDLGGSESVAQDINENVMVQIAGVLGMGPLAAEHHLIMSGLGIGALAQGTAAQHMTQLLAHLSDQNNPYLHLIANNLQAIMTLLQQASQGGLNPQSVYRAQFNNQRAITGQATPPVTLQPLGQHSLAELLPSINAMAQSIVQHFNDLPSVPTLTVIGLGGILSPLNGNNIVVFTIPSNGQVVTIMMSPLLGVMVTESQNSQAVVEYLYRMLGLLVTTQVTDSVLIASASPSLGHGAWQNLMLYTGQLCSMAADLCQWFGQALSGEPGTDANTQGAIEPGKEKKYLKDKEE